MRKISIKKLFSNLKPVIWIKSIFLVLIGLETTRFGVGVGRVNVNINFGSAVFVLIAISGILVVFALKNTDKKGDGKNDIKFKRILVGCISLFGVGYGLALYHTIVYNLESLNLFLLAFLGITWFLSIYYGKDWKYNAILRNIIISLSFSFGLLYGASLNNAFLPAVIYLFFGAIFLLQISKDLINDCKHIERDNREGSKSFANIIGEEKAQKLSLIFNLLVILFLLIPMFPGFPNIFAQTFYTIVTIITIIFLAISTLLSFRMNKERTYYRVIKILLRCGMFLIFLAFILANF